MQNTIAQNETGRTRDEVRRARIGAMVIESLAADEAELRARVIDLTSERDAYRELLQVALDALRASELKQRTQSDRLRVLTATARQLVAA